MLNPGIKLGHYSIVAQIGAGGRGEVYRATDTRLGREVALKVLPAGALADEAARKRFHKEAIALSKLNHPNVETLYEFDSHEGVDFLVMELIGGVTLDEKLAQGPLSEKDVLRLGQQLAEGLAAAHEQGVIHRDLKPGNLRLTPDGRLKILDFGLAKLLRPVAETATTESFTETQAVAGTLPYMAPEQLRGQAADTRTDIWMAGVVLYELATARLPFLEKLPTALADDILHKAPPTPGRLNPELSSRLEEIILKCLEKDPDHRYQSAREVLADFRRLAAPAAAPRIQPRRRWVAALVVLVVPGVLALLLALNVGGLRERLLGRAGSPQIQSLAVLPLKNLMRDPDQDYFVEGMHEALITELSKISALKVISRTSTLGYRQTEKRAPEIARDLGVTGLIEGSVLREADQVRITVQLIHGPTDRNLWAQSFDRELRGILALQSEAARTIAEQIKVTLSPQEQARLAGARPVNPDAYEAYLKGRYYFESWRTPEGLQRGIEYFERAIEKDPQYALAYVGLGDSYLVLADQAVIPSVEGYARAKAAIQRALEIDETLADAHVLLAGLMFGFEWGWSGAEKQFREAIQRNPGHPRGHHLYGRFLRNMGRYDEALAELEQARNLDPLSIAINVALANTYYFARRYDKALEQAQKIFEVDASNAHAHLLVGTAYVQKRLFNRGMAEIEKAVALSGGQTVMQLLLARAYAVAGSKNRARKLLNELIEQSDRTHVSPFFVALVYVGLGERGPAFAWLEKAYRARDSDMTTVKVLPDLDPLRDDPRFQDLLRRMNFPE